MEDQIEHPQSATPPPIQSPTSRRFSLSTLILSLLLVTSLLLSSLLYYQNYQLRMQIADLEPIPISSPSPSLIPESPPSINTRLSENLPTGWLYSSNGLCGVEVPTPPSYEGDMHWVFGQGGAYPNILSKLPNWEEHMQAPMMYINKLDGGSDNVPYAVIVSCLDNTDDIDNAVALTLLENGIDTYNQHDNSSRIGAQSYTIKSSTEDERWGHTVLDLVLTGYHDNSGGDPFSRDENYTLFTTDDYIYEVRVMALLEDQSVIDQAELIFELLIFE